MILENTIIVTEKQVRARYKEHSPARYERYTRVLHDNDLLPLSAATLLTPSGMALLRITDWVYLSGSLSRVQYIPKVSASKPGVLELIQKSAAELGVKFNDDSRNAYVLSGNAGSIGRLMNSMGIPRAPSNAIRTTRAPKYHRDLPHYIREIAAIRPEHNPERRELLRIIAQDFLYDRFSMHATPSSSKKRFSIRCGSFVSKRTAEKYLRQVIDFLNAVFPGYKKSKLFTESQTDAYPSRSKGLFAATIRLNNAQVGYLATKNPSILNVEVNF